MSDKRLNWTTLTQGDQLNTETELRDRIAHLEQALGQSEKELESFLYSVSHDLRGPLRAILSSSMILIEDFGEKLGVEGKAELERQSKAARKISQLLEGVLRLSRLGRQPIQLAEVNLSQVTLDAIKDASSSSARFIESDVESGIVVFADASLVKVTLAELIGNAVKFSDVSRPVEIRFGKGEGCFYLEDRGIGFDAALGEQIFRPFERLHGDNDYPGIGVGLSLAKLAIKRLGGQIWADSSRGEGSTFKFTLPQPIE